MKTQAKKLKRVNPIKTIKDVRAVDRFFAAKLFTVKTEHGECWDVNGSKFSNGYSRVGHEDANLLGITRAHIFMFHLVYQRLPKDIIRGGIVLHKCDNRWCVNPGHLFLGNHAQNMQDMVNKDRAAKGEDVGNNRYTEKEIILIKYLLKRRGFSPKEIAFMFDTGQSTIQHILSGRTWEHLSIPEDYTLDVALNQIRKLRKRGIIKGFPIYAKCTEAEPYIKIKDKHFNLLLNLVRYYGNVAAVAEMLLLARNSVRNILEKEPKYRELKLEQMMAELAVYLRYREGNRRIVATILKRV